jgi:ABC-2 type transport system permease protein
MTAFFLPRKGIAFLKRDFLDAASYKLSFLYSLIGVFFSSATFFFISKLIAPGSMSLSAYGGDYFSFAMIGIAFSGLLGIFQEGLPSVIRNAQVSGTLEALLVTPTSIQTILFGSSLYSIVFAFLRTAIHLIMGVFIFGMSFGRIQWPALFFVLALTTVCFISLGILSASFILVFKMGNPVSWLFGSVQGLLGGMLFPVSILPSWMGWAAKFLPVTHALEGLRLSLLGSATFADVLPSLMALAAFDIVLTPLGLWLFRIALRKARRDGTLSHY